ncbi:Flp pilus assembly protein CpaB [Candidatus Omnitrophota bacterium]
MKKGKNVILLIISILSGISAAFFIVYYLNTYRATTEVSTVDFLKIVASSEAIEMGDNLDSDNMTFMNWPKKELPEDYYVSLGDVKGMVASARIPKGVPITKSLTISAKDRLESLIPQNFRAMTIDLTKYGGIPDFIEVGSYVDVIATFDKNTSNPISKTILQNVKVLKISRRNKEKNIDRDTLTLVMSVSDAERLSLSMAKGSIRVTLRNKGDMDSVDADGIDSEELIWGISRKDAVVEPKPFIKMPRRETVEIIRGVEKKVETLRTRQ